MQSTTVFVLSQTRASHRHTVTMLQKRKCKVVRPTSLKKDESRVRVVDFYAHDLCLLISLIDICRQNGPVVVANVDVFLGEKDQALENFLSAVRYFQKESNATLSAFVSDVWASISESLSSEDFDKLSLVL